MAPVVLSFILFCCPASLLPLEKLAAKSLKFSCFHARSATFLIFRRAFDSQDQSGGGGFISQGVLPEVLAQANVKMPQDMVDNLRAGDIIVWNDFWQDLLQVDKSRGGLKDDESSMCKKVFELYHFNGIAKTVVNASAVDDVIQQRPRLTRLRVSVQWTPDSMLLESAESAKDGKSSSVEKEPAQHAPLVDCIRTRKRCRELGVCRSEFGRLLLAPFRCLSFITESSFRRMCNFWHFFAL